jgi:hypothetical protein
MQLCSTGSGEVPYVADAKGNEQQTRLVEVIVVLVNDRNSRLISAVDLA